MLETLLCHYKHTISHFSTEEQRKLAQYIKPQATISIIVPLSPVSKQGPDMIHYIKIALFLRQRVWKTKFVPLTVSADKKTFRIHYILFRAFLGFSFPISHPSVWLMPDAVLTCTSERLGDVD